MNPDDLAHILDDLGRRLGPTGEYVFALAVRQQYIDGVVHLLVGLVLGALALGMTLTMRAYWRRGWAAWDALSSSEKNYPTLNGRPELIGFALFSIVPLVVTVAALLALSSAIGELLNPEYAALRDILSAIGGNP